MFKHHAAPIDVLLPLQLAPSVDLGSAFHGVLRIDDGAQSFDRMQKADATFLLSQLEALHGRCSTGVVQQRLEAAACPSAFTSAFLLARAILLHDHLRAPEEAVSILQQVDATLSAVPPLPADNPFLIVYKAKVQSKLGNALRCTGRRQEALRHLCAADSALDERFCGTGQYRAFRASTAALVGKTLLSDRQNPESLQRAKQHLLVAVRYYEGLSLPDRARWAQHNLVRVHIALGEFDHAKARRRQLQEAAGEELCARARALFLLSDILFEQAFQPIDLLKHDRPWDALELFKQSLEEAQEACKTHAALAAGQCTCLPGTERLWGKRQTFIRRYVQRAEDRATASLLAVP
jgi:tetratricopeptide (TPR) repeat protein